ncbi:MAG: hypothetical protein EBR28_07845 [Planctomycetia bacterium]|nr:hypothetical protein [Planctomycetia bacterium]
MACGGIAWVAWRCRQRRSS